MEPVLLGEIVACSGDGLPHQRKRCGGVKNFTISSDNIIINHPVIRQPRRYIFF